MAVLLSLGYAANLKGSAAKAFDSHAGSDTVTLVVNVPVEREMAGVETHSFKVMLEFGQYLLATVEQQGVDLTIALIRADGQQLFEANSAYTRYGSLWASTIADTGGEYRIEIRPSKKDFHPGRYRLVVEALRVPTAADLSRINAERIFREARKIVQQHDVNQLPMAIEKYREAVPYWKSAGDRRGEAITFFCLSEAYRTLYKLSEARECLEQAISLNQAMGDRQGLAYALKDLGLTYMHMDKYSDAARYLEQALPIANEISNDFLKGTTINILGGAYDSLGDPDKALQYYNQALDIRRSQGNLRGQKTTLGNIGTIYDQIGESQKALEYYNQSLILLDSLKSLTIEDQRSRGSLLTSIGFVYEQLGDRDRALEYYNQALQIVIKTDDKRIEALLLMLIGQMHALKGEPDKALKYYNQALQIRRSIPDRLGEAYSLTYIGYAYAAAGKPEEALSYFDKASHIHKDFSNRYLQADLLTKVGEAHALLHDQEKALAAFDQSILLWKALNNQRGEAFALYGLARIARERGDLAQARKHSEEAINRIESLRSKIAGHEYRATYMASVRDLYELNIDLLMRLHKIEPSAGHDAAAFHASEQARARGLVEILTEAGVNIRQGVDPTLIERERRLRQQLNLKAERQMKLPSDKDTEEQKAEAEKELTKILTQYQDVQAQIRSKSPGYAALTQPQPLKLSEAQQKQIDSDTMLLEYSLGEERSYLWAVTQSAVTSYELPGRKEIEDSAKRVYDIFRAPQPVQGETFATRRARIARYREQFAAEAPRLSQMLLGPVAAQLRNKRLVVVSEGAIQFIPFSALPTPQAPATGLTRSPESAYRPLILDHEIVNLPSASALAVLRQGIASRKPAPKALAVLADPVFEVDDPRIKAASAKPAAKPSDRPSQSIVSSVRDGFSLHRLRASGFEAEAILAVAPPGNSMCATGLDASLERANSGELSQYRIIHFATHGLVNNKHPELSAIALSLLDKQGNQQPGFLRLHDIYNLNLAADLVVLSACDTGLGKDIRGEGLVGLTRGFMYAGAARVVASLWKVDDDATAELMGRFYRKLLKEKLRPAAALRTAQIEMLGNKRWELPYYWSAFILQGEWK